MVNRIARLFLAWALILGAGTSCVGQGIPLPGITLYGVILNQDGATRVTSGLLEFTYAPTVGDPVTVQAPLRNFNNQFSYVVNIPVEIGVEEMSISMNALPLPDADVTYSRSANVGGTALAFPTGQEMTTLSPDQHRGVVQRLDLQATGPISVIEDADNNGVVNRLDVLAWFQFWKDSLPTKFDFDGSGSIDAPDLIHLLETIQAND